MRSEGKCERTFDGGETVITNISPSQDSTHPDCTMQFIPGFKHYMVEFWCNQKHHKRKKKKKKNRDTCFIFTWITFAC